MLHTIMTQNIKSWSRHKICHASITVSWGKLWVYQSRFLFSYCPASSISLHVTVDPDWLSIIPFRVNLSLSWLLHPVDLYLWAVCGVWVRELGYSARIKKIKSMKDRTTRGEIELVTNRTLHTSGKFSKDKTDVLSISFSLYFHSIVWKGCQSSQLITRHRWI